MQSVTRMFLKRISLINISIIKKVKSLQSHNLQLSTFLLLLTLLFGEGLG